MIVADQEPTVALLLSGIGIYGVIAFLVAERRREIAVRIAIGALPRIVMAETVRRGLGPMVIGLGLGAATALAVGGALRRFLFEIAPKCWGIGAGNPVGPDSARDGSSGLSPPIRTTVLAPASSDFCRTRSR